MPIDVQALNSRIKFILIFAFVGAAMANETWKFVRAKSKQAMKQVLGIKDEAARMKVTPPLAVAPLAHGDDEINTMV